ncbi:MAG: pyridoxamine 5-phosphate oxidase [Pseudomonadota bacterium]
MKTPKPETFRETDAEALGLARRLIGDARHGALGVMIEGAPFVTRIALAPNADHLVTLISDLAPHTGGLRTTPEASLLIGDPGKGDPLAHPRMTLQVSAGFLEKSETAMTSYLAAQPKAQLYISFTDFHLVKLSIRDAWLNGGFGKAYRLGPDDLR